MERRQIRNGGVVFPENLTPFPDTAGGDIIEMNVPPAQKLRPIRCNGARNFTEPDYPDPHNLLAGSQLTTSTSCYYGTAELGFLAQKPPPSSLLNKGGGGPPSDHSPPQPYISSCALPEFGGCRGAAAALRQFKFEMDADIMNLISQGRILEAQLLSSSSDDGSESSEAMKEPMSRKRKRKTRKMLELFMESMTRKVVQKQEQMHKQLMEILEKNEKERIIREEAWKQQEIERARRDEEMRTEETSRSVALISFIQNLLGHEIQIPKPSCEVSCPEKDEEDITNHENFESDPSNRRWPKSEVQSLIAVRAALDRKFLNGNKGSVWEEVAVGMSKMGFSRTAKRCKEKWENINKYYKSTMESGRENPEYIKSCPYFHELDILYRGGLITLGNATNYIKHEIENKSV